MSLIKTIAIVEALIIAALVSYLLLPKLSAPVALVQNQSCHSLITPESSRPTAPKSQSKSKNYSGFKTLNAKTDSNIPQNLELDFNNLLEQFAKTATQEEFEQLAQQHADDLFRLVNQNPALIDDILQAYSQVQHPDAASLFFELMMSSEDKNLESKIVEKLENAPQNETKKWFKLMTYIGANNEKSRQLVLQKMQQADSPSLILAMQALQPSNAYSHERKKITTTLTQYLQHQDDSVRASALRSLGHWSRGKKQSKQQETLVIQGLNDSATLMKFSAILSIYENNITSDKVKNKLLNIMRDVNQNIEERFIAANALERFELTDTEHDKRINTIKNMRQNNPDIDQRIDQKFQVLHNP